MAQLFLDCSPFAPYICIINFKFNEMRIFTNLPKTNDRVKLTTIANVVAEGDHPRVDVESIETVAGYKVQYSSDFRVTRTELDNPEPYVVVEYDFLHLDGEVSWVQLDVPLKDIKTLNGEAVKYIEIPKNYDPVLSDSFPPICLN